MSSLKQVSLRYYMNQPSLNELDLVSGKFFQVLSQLKLTTAVGAYPFDFVYYGGKLVVTQCVADYVRRKQSLSGIRF